MKNSSKYLLAAVLVLLASLTGYNMALRAEYHRGDYKDPLHGYVSLGFQGFREVVVPAASIVGVKIVEGPFRVRINPKATDFIQVRQQGQRLIITAVFPGQRQNFGSEAVVLSCPRLTALTTDATYQEQGRRVVEKSFERYNPTVQVQGFTQDSLLLSQDNGSRIELTGNKLTYLRAVAGRSSGSHAQLQLNASNQIAAADLAVGHQSELTLDNVLIPKLHHQFGDSAKVTLLGRALGSLAQ